VCWVCLQDFKGAAALSAEAKALAAQADLATAKAKKLRQQVHQLQWQLACAMHLSIPLSMLLTIPLQLAVPSVTAFLCLQSGFHTQLWALHQARLVITRWTCKLLLYYAHAWQTPATACTRQLTTTMFAARCIVCIAALACGGIQYCKEGPDLCWACR